MISVDVNPAAALAIQNQEAVPLSAAPTTDFASQLLSVSHKGRDLDPIFEKAAKTYNVPFELLRSIAFHESGFQPQAVSHMGAMGIMQLMPVTAQTMGVTDPYNPEQNIMGGAKLLSQYLEKYDGDLKLTLAAYGAGSGAVAKYDGVPPYAETQKFVEDIMSTVDQEIIAHAPQPVPFPTVVQVNGQPTETSAPTLSAGLAALASYQTSQQANQSAYSVYPTLLEQMMEFDGYSEDDYSTLLTFLLADSSGMFYLG